jgi:hypothetical protein
MNDAPMLLTDRGKPDTTARFVLSALAEHAHPDGTNAYPGVPKIQHKTGFSRRTVQEALARLEKGGLIVATGMKGETVNWTLSMHRKRPGSDWDVINAETEKRKAATAERVRRHRAKDVTPSNSVTSEADVTLFGDVRNAVERRSVTPSDAPEPVVKEPVVEPLSAAVPETDPPEPPAAPVDEREISPLVQKLMAIHDAAAVEVQTVLDQVGREGWCNSLSSWALSEKGELDITERLAKVRAVPLVASVDPWQTCACDRPFRAPEPGPCRDCREKAVQPEPAAVIEQPSEGRQKYLATRQALRRPALPPVPPPQSAS